MLCPRDAKHQGGGHERQNHLMQRRHQMEKGRDDRNRWKAKQLVHHQLQVLLLQTPMAHEPYATAAACTGAKSEPTRRQTNQVNHGCTAQAQRCTPARIASVCLRSSSKGRSTRNQTDAPCGYSAWKSQKGTPTGATGQAQPTCSLAGIPRACCQLVARLQRAICRARETNGGESNSSSRSTGNCKGEPCTIQAGSRSRSQRGCNDNQRGRHRQGCFWSNCRKDQRRHLQFAYQFGSAEIFGRTDGRGGTQSTEETKDRCITHGCHHPCTSIQHRFWLGPANIAEGHIAPGPKQNQKPISAIEQKWLHNVVHDPAFLSEWAAIDQARHLAWILGNTMPILFDHQDMIPHQPIRQHAVPSKHVVFDDFVEVHIDVEMPSVSFKHLTIHGSVQATILKYCANFALHVDEDSHVNVPQFSPFAGKDTIRKVDRCQQNTHTTFCCPSTLATTSSVGLATNTNAFCPCTSFAQQSDPVAEAFKHSWTCQDSRNACTDSRSDAALASSFVHKRPNATFVEGNNLTRLSPGALVCRLEHQSPIEDRNAHSDNSDDEDDTPDDHNDQPLRPYQPAFVHRLEALVRAQGMHPDDGNFDLPVRTWYINHVTTHRWTSPRLLQIVGPPHTWEAQVSALWIDQIDDQDWFDVFVVEPDPPRIARHQFVMFDLIVTQALDSTRQAGLITVMPAQSHMFAMYAVAGSFPETVSGDDIVQIADAAQFCLFRVCTITHRWHRIPHTLTPTHMVGSGDGYQILVHEPQVVRGQATSSTSVSDQDSNMPPSMPTKQRRIEEPTRPVNSSRSSVSRSSHESVRTLHIFQLEGCEVVVPLTYHQPLLPTHELAAMLQIPLDCLETFHVMPLRPDGLPEQDVAAIVQRSGDVQTRTTDQLIMIDIYEMIF